MHLDLPQAQSFFPIEMGSNHPALSGVYVSTITIFKYTEKQEIDIKATIEHISNLKRSGIKGALIFGSEGEQVAITREERKELIRVICEVFPSHSGRNSGTGVLPPHEHDFHNFIGVGGQSTQESITLAKDAAESGARFAVAYPPNYYATNMTSDVVESFYTDLANESPIPVLMYLGAVTGVNIMSDSVQRLASHKNIIGIIQVPPYNTISLLRQNVAETFNRKFYVFEGASDNLLDALQNGIHGTMTPMANFFPRTIQRIYYLFRKGEMDEAENLQKQLTAAEQCIQKYGMPATKYATAYLRNFDESMAKPRRPIPSPSTEAKEEIENSLSVPAWYEKQLEKRSFPL